MNSRRTFLKGALSTAAAATITTVATSTLTNNTFAASQNTMAGIVYTKENPGKWAKKVGGHLPSIKIDGQKVTVETDHGMSAKHFIVRHTLVSKDGEVLGEKTFTPDDEAVSSYTLPAGYKGKLYATSFCNKHDFWLAESKV
ncbi:MAG: twin-arginine translocation signal domain-containing protein [gamma proteobacterium symbiont of Lucinoma myriamae]|nr:twin-arginine translocation signal domain-containing protein [gamma proteobacterium symbiont of Lucinoma myriamae]